MQKVQDRFAVQVPELPDTIDTATYSKYMSRLFAFSLLLDSTLACCCNVFLKKKSSCPTAFRDHSCSLTLYLSHCLSLSISLTVSLSLPLSLYLSHFLCLSLSLSPSLSLSLSLSLFLSLSHSLSISLPSSLSLFS